MSPQTSPGQKCTTALKKWSIGSPGGGPFSGPARVRARARAHSAKPGIPESAHSRKPRFPEFPDFPNLHISRKPEIPEFPDLQNPENPEIRREKRGQKRGPKSDLFRQIPKISPDLTKTRKPEKKASKCRKKGQKPVQRNPNYPNFGGAPFQILKLYKGYRTTKVEKVKREDSRTGYAPPIRPKKSVTHPNCAVMARVPTAAKILSEQLCSDKNESHEHTNKRRSPCS